MRALAALLFTLGLASSAEAQVPRLRAEPRGEGVLRIDGRLDEDAWTRAPLGTDFIERSPHPGDRPPVATTVRVLYDAGAIYVGVEAFLEPGEAPRGLELTRDSMGIWEDDAISVKVDPRRDGRTTLGFVVNPANAQLDYLAVDNGAALRREHDMIWESAVSVAADRWIVELRLPVHALGLPAGDEAREIGLNVTRDHNARSATYDWSPTLPEFGAFSAVHYGVLEGVRAGGGGVPAMVQLYSLGEYRSLDPSGVAHALRGSAGVDAWVRLAADTWLEATLLTDFSQVDLDDALVNLDRFPLFFPERRPFFLNGLDVFAAGISEQLQPFYSRRIGLSRQGEVLPVLGGVKLFGREGSVSFGILDVLTDATLESPATNDLAARARVSLDGRASYVGAMVTTRVPFRFDEGYAGGLQATYAADTLVRFAGERLEIYTLAAGTARDDTSAREGGEGAAAAVRVQYRGEILQPVLSSLWAGPGFEPELGFVRRPEASRTRLDLPFVARPSGVVRRASLQLGGEVQATAYFERAVYLLGYVDLELELFDGWVLGAGADYIEDTVLEDFEIVPGVFARSGTWRGANLDVWLSSPGQRNPVIELYYGVNNAYFGGTLHNPYARLRAGIGPHFRFDVTADVYYVELRDYAPFWTAGVNALFRVTPSTDLQIDLLGRIDGESERGTGMLRLRWRYRPGSDLFLVWREDVAWAGGQVVNERTITAKMTLRFDVLL
jgi:hypothetical protein